MQIPGFYGLPPLALAKRSLHEFLEDDMATYAAALAYHTLFALFPFLIFLLALLGFLQLPGFFDWLVEQAQTFLPQPVLEPSLQVLEEIQDHRDGGLLSLGILGAIWVASAGVRSTMNALNAAYDVEEGRPAWKRYLLSIAYTLGLAGTLIAAAALMTLGPGVIRWLASQVGLGGLVVTLWTWLRLPVAAALLLAVIAVVYHVAPNVEQPFRVITPGALLALVAWLVTSLGFALYLSNFANYSATYGSIGAVIVLLLYFYLSASALLLGAEVNAVIAHHARTLNAGGSVRQRE